MLLEGARRIFDRINGIEKPRCVDGLPISTLFCHLKILSFRSFHPKTFLSRVSVAPDDFHCRDVAGKG